MDWAAKYATPETAGYEPPEEGIRMQSLSAVVVSEDTKRRRALTGALTSQGVTIGREFSEYPGFDALVKATEADSHIVVIDLVPNVEVALNLVENISASNPALTVMVYGSGNDPELLMRSMRAGAREFLAQPISAESLPETLVRAAARLELSQTKKTAGKLLLFASAKGGAGVTTLASNFALALKQESEKEVALVDLNLQLGDVSVLLGMTPRYTVLDALNSGGRMDVDLVSSLMAQHASGLSVLAGPDEFHAVVTSDNGNLRKLLRILRARFPFVVVDGGSGLGPEAETLLQLADVVYLVTQADIPALRNAQRILSHVQQSAQAHRSMEVVLNRFDSHGGISQDQIERTLTAPVKWKIPNDYAAARGSNNMGAPLVLQKSALSTALRHMAQAACGKNPESGKKRKFGLFG
jgi:pilus assembly protein CpaE